MNEPHEPTIRKFNPGTFQSDEEVIRQFVVRKRELGIVLDTLRGNVGPPSCQHVLLVGPRGRGKTVLLARAAAEIRTDEELSGQLLPVRFMEESHEIFDLGDFWLEALFYLALEVSNSHPRISRDLRTTHAAFARQGHGVEIEERARATVLETADRLGRRLVLMVENLQALCGDVDDDFGWKLRESLQTEPKVTLLATATSRFEGLDDAREPFFELFRIVCLERLDTEECQRLWQMASGEQRSKQQIKALEILTGGDPRLLVIVAEFSRHRSLRDLMEEMVSLIDDHTEYFRSHLDGFAKTERRVYLAVIDLWRPSYANEIAARARMDIRTVSALLGRLADRGVIAVEGGDRKRQYSATQRLYSIYYKLRRERDEAVVVRNLIHFMAVFYTDEELTEMSGKLRLEALQYPFIREGIEWAMAEQPDIRRLFLKMGSLEIKGFEENDIVKYHAEFVMELVNRGFAQAENRETEAAIATWDELLQCLENIDVPELQTVVAHVLTFKGVAQAQNGETEAAIATCNGVIQQFENNHTPELQTVVAKASVNKGLMQAQNGETEAAIATYDGVIQRFENNHIPELQTVVANALVNKGVAQAQNGETEAAIATYDEAIQRFENNHTPELQTVVADALVHKGFAQSEGGDTEAAIATCDEVIERFENNDAPGFRAAVANALISKGIVQAEGGDSEAAITACNNVIQRFENDDISEFQTTTARAFLVKGEVEAALRRTEDALHTCDELERKFASLTDRDAIPFAWYAGRIRTKVLVVREEHPAAMDAFHSVYAAFIPDNEMMLNIMIYLVIDLVVEGASERDLVEILVSDQEKSAKLEPLVVALRKRMGEKVRAPVEMMEVATSILQFIDMEIADASSVTTD